MSLADIIQIIIGVLSLVATIAVSFLIYGYHVDADDFRTTRVVIQCKRFNSNPVSEPDINQFLGAMNKYQADYGVFITNSRFTNKAREAAREGTPITLIDGNDLIRLVIKYELYITPVTTYVLDGFYTED